MEFQYTATDIIDFIDLIKKEWLTPLIKSFLFVSINISMFSIYRELKNDIFLFIYGILLILFYIVSIVHMINILVNRNAVKDNLSRMYFKVYFYLQANFKYSELLFLLNKFKGRVPATPLIVNITTVTSIINIIFMILIWIWLII